jgi:hypothetical protein
MPVTEDLRESADRADRELDAVHDFFQHSKIVWRSFHILADAADVVQDVVAVLARKLPTFQYEPARSFRSWPRMVLLNRCRDQRRRRGGCAGRPDAARCGGPGPGRLVCRRGVVPGPGPACPGPDAGRVPRNERLVVGGEEIYGNEWEINLCDGTGKTSAVRATSNCGTSAAKTR